MPQTDIIILSDSQKQDIYKSIDTISNLSTKEKQEIKDYLFYQEPAQKEEKPPVSAGLLLVILFVIMLGVYYFFPKVISFITRLIFSPFKNKLKGDFRFLVDTEEKEDDYTEESPVYTHQSNSPVFINTSQNPKLVYEGNSLYFSYEEYTHVLNKRNPFFAGLSVTNQHRFIERLKSFISHKRFVIHDEKGFKEMPILISASSVQLSFGLNEYLLPHFNEIHVYPDAFFGYNPLRVLVGNVSGNTINISWKHYLEGTANEHDNSHVGLHEMAHALYYQNMMTKMDEDEDFAHAFPGYNKVFDNVYNIEKNVDGLYTEYGTKNFQEFWAESIEIFFENPDKLKAQYPDLFNAITDILNLNPLNQSNPVIA